MAKLSKLFEAIDSKSQLEQKKINLYSKKLLESYNLYESESLDNNIEEELFEEAKKYKTEEEAIGFVNVVRDRALNEGFGDALKKAGSWIKDKAKAVVDAIKNWFNGPIKTAFKKFHNAVEPFVIELQKNGLKKVSESLVLESLLLEEASEGESKPAPEDADGINLKIVPKIIARILKKSEFKSKNYLTTKLHFLLVMQNGSEMNLFVGADEATKKLFLSYDPSNKSLSLFLHKEIITTKKELKLVIAVIKEFNRQLGGKLFGDDISFELSSNTINILKDEKDLKKIKIGSDIRIKNNDFKPITLDGDDLIPDNVIQPKEWIETVLKNSSAMNLDPNLVANLKVEPKNVWSHFMAFAKEKGYDFPDIINATDDASGDHNPMTDNEFIAYATQIDSMVSYIKQNLGKTLDSGKYDMTAFNNFLVSISSPANKLATVLIQELGEEKKQAEKNSKGPAVQSKTVINNTTIKTLEKTNPDIIPVVQKLNPKQQESLSKVVDNETIVKNKSFARIITKTDFLTDNKNIEKKREFLNNLIVLKATDDQIMKTIDFIMKNGIEKNFQTISPFTSAKETLEFLNNGGNFDDKNIEVFKKSIF